MKYLKVIPGNFPNSFNLVNNENKNIMLEWIINEEDQRFFSDETIKSLDPHQILKLEALKSAITYIGPSECTKEKLVDIAKLFLKFLME